MQDAQNRRDGYVPHTAPFQGAGGGAGWGSAYAILPWRCYEYYGDPQFLREHYAGMKRWVAYLGTWSREGIVHKKRPGEWVNLGDWCVPGDPPPTELVDTYLYAQCALNVARAARVLGYDRDATQYEALHDSIREAFHRAFYQADAGHSELTKEVAESPLDPQVHFLQLGPSFSSFASVPLTEGNEGNEEPGN
jgi:alpha-L-rhamnosidase